MKQYKNVDEFIEKSSLEAQSILKNLREMFIETLPNVEEKIDYGVPQYKLGKKSFGLSVAKTHITIDFDFGMTPDSIRERLEQKSTS